MDEADSPICEVCAISCAGNEVAKVCLPPSSNILALKQAIAAEPGLPAPAGMDLLSDVILEDTQTLEELGFGDMATVQIVIHMPWKLLTRHRISEGLFQGGEFTKNNTDQDAGLFADLEIDYDNFRDKDGKLVFRIVWPSLAQDRAGLDKNFMVWIQTSTPLNSAVQGYEPICVPYPGTGETYTDQRGISFDISFGGVVASTHRGHALIDGNANSMCWNYTMAGCSYWHGLGGRSLPGPILPGFSSGIPDTSVAVSEVELWISCNPYLALAQCSDAAWDVEDQV